MSDEQGSLERQHHHHHQKSHQQQNHKANFESPHRPQAMRTTDDCSTCSSSACVFVRVILLLVSVGLLVLAFRFILAHYFAVASEEAVNDSFGRVNTGGKGGENSSLLLLKNDGDAIIQRSLPNHNSTVAPGTPGISTSPTAKT